MAGETRVAHDWYGCETGCCGYRAEYAAGGESFYFDHPSTLSELAALCREAGESIAFGAVHCPEYGETPMNDLDPSGPDRVELVLDEPAEEQ